MSEDRPNTILTINPDLPDPAIIARAAGIISGGGMVIFPTQSLYGLGTNALDKSAVNRIFEVKNRPPDKPILILIDRVSDMDSLVRDIPKAAHQIMDVFWPGGVTLVCHASSDLPSNLTAGTGKIGIRMPLHPVTRELVKQAAVPVTGTSANLSSRTGCANVGEIDALVLDRVDMVLDAGTLKGGKGSTIVDVTATPPRILREGLIPSVRILDAISGQ